LLEVSGISKNFSGLRAVQEVSFAVPEAAIFAVIGPNGAGKTTLFNMIAGVFPPNEGTITFAGERIDGHPPDEVCRRGIGRTFQLVRPFPALTVEENVIVGALLHRTQVTAARQRAHEVLRQLDLFDKRAQRASALTLPDRKRLEVARALATDPKLLLLDEVMAGLNAVEVDEVVELIKKMRDRGVTILVIEHVMKAIRRLADRLLVLHHGQQIAEGRTDEVLSEPRVIEAYLGKRRQ